MNAARHVALALTVVLLAACGADELFDDGAAAPTEPAPTDPVPEPTPTDPTEEPTDMDDEGPQQTITGMLGGDPMLEGGCAWLETSDGGRYEVLWPEGYHIEWEPLQLVGPDGDVVAASGDELEVTGSVSQDMASICMVGTIFSATSVSPG